MHHRWRQKKLREKTHPDSALFLSSNLQPNCPSFPESYWHHCGGKFQQVQKHKIAFD